MPWALEAKPTGLPPEFFYTELFHLLIVGPTNSKFGCLAIMAKPYPVWGPSYLPLIANQLYCMSKYAHEVLGTILKARPRPVLTHKINRFVLTLLKLCI